MTTSARPMLAQHGLTNLGAIHRNLPTSFLYEESVKRTESRIAHLGPLVVRTGEHTGRAPKDKFVVREPATERDVWWDLTQALAAEHFERIRLRLLAYFEGRDVFVQDAFLCTEPSLRTPVRIITETAWHSLFVRNLFLHADDHEVETFAPQLTIIHAPNFHAIPEVDGTRSEAFIALHLSRRLILIGGTAYAGEIKKSAFTYFNFVLPQQGVLSMHASANAGSDGRTVLFFGLSGTGKTTLSTDPRRALIGDDEIGWNDRGLFNVEGGCYAKVIRISAKDEPGIYQTTRQFGTILENVGFDASSGRLNLEDASLTENTRAAYPIGHIPNAVLGGTGSHPSNLFMLTADAFGVLPPIARLSTEQALYYFLSGYTAKVAGTEAGVAAPTATFSPCFGAPFMARSPVIYAELLGERIAKHRADVWLVNTGWTGGVYGVGRWVPIAVTRILVHAAIDGSLARSPTQTDGVFGFEVPTQAPGEAADLLDPRRTWSNSNAYEVQAHQLATLFRDNFLQFEREVPPAVAMAGPHSNSRARPRNSNENVHEHPGEYHERQPGSRSR